VRTGRRHQSLTLVADGRHVLSDSYTSAGILAGLLLVKWNGLAVARFARRVRVALLLFWTGFHLVRHGRRRPCSTEEDPSSSRAW